MAAPSFFDADKLRSLIEQKRTASDIKKELDITQTTLKNHLLKLIQQDNKVYKIAGMGTRDVNPKVTKNGLKITKAKMDSFGFTEDKKVKIEKITDGQIKITQID